MDSLVERARECHLKSMTLSGQSHQFREQRDQLIRRAYREGGVSYSELAKQVGCSPELVAKAVQQGSIP
jgi:ribosome-binding protein aMBF1 (putative translation factor)